MKVIISKYKRDKIESLLFGGFGAVAIVVSMNNGNVTDNVITIRDKVIRQILDLLDNKKR